MWCLSGKAAVLAAAVYACATAASVRAAAPQVELPVAARTDDVDSDWTAIVYSSSARNPVLVGNDGGASSGGFRTFELDGQSSPIPESKHETPGRTKLVTTLYDVGGKDLLITIAQTDSLFRLYDASTVEEVGPPLRETLGDWSALCAWKSQSSGEQYLYLFGKHQAIQFLLRERQGALDITEIQTFKTPVEASSCAVSLSAQSVFFSGDHDAAVYVFKASESTVGPNITHLGDVDDDITGLATYIGNGSDYLAVAQKDVVSIYDVSLKALGSFKLTGDEDIEAKGLSFYQAPISNYSAGVLAYAIESEAGKGFAVSSLATAFQTLGLNVNTAYNPRKLPPHKPVPTVCSECNDNGFCGSGSRFSGRGKCTVCHCSPPSRQLLYMVGHCMDEYGAHDCWPFLHIPATRLEVKPVLTQYIAVFRRLRWKHVRRLYLPQRLLRSRDLCRCQPVQVRGGLGRTLLRLQGCRARGRDGCQWRRWRRPRNLGKSICQGAVEDHHDNQVGVRRWLCGV